MNGEYVEPEIEVFPEKAFFNSAGKIAVCCGNDPRVRLDRLIATDALKTTFL